MSVLTRLRVSAGVWLAPIVLVLVAFNLTGGAPGQYPVAVATTWASNLVLAVGLVSLAGAWEAARLRAGGVLARSPRRSVARVLSGPLLWSVVPTLVVAFIVEGALTAASAPVVGTTLLILLAWTSLGLLIGLTLPRAFALPLALVAGTFWAALAPGAQSPVLRYLAGNLDRLLHQQSIA